MILLGGTERLKKFLRESISEEFNNVQQNAVEFVHLGMVGRDSGSHMFQMFSKSELYHCIHLLQRPEAIPWWKSNSPRGHGSHRGVAGDPRFHLLPREGTLGLEVAMEIYFFQDIWGVPKMGVSPKWMVYNSL